MGKNKKLEIALDLGLLEDKLFLSANWYRERSGNQLITIQLPRITGFSGVEGNLDAVVQNTGWEFLIETSSFEENELSWKSSINLTIPKNKLVAFPDLESSSYATTYEIGKPLGIVKLLKYTGVDSETGLYSFEDVNNDGVLSNEDQIITKDLSRKFYGGWLNNFQYKNWGLDVLFEFVKQEGWSHLTDYGIPGGQVGTRKNAPIDYLNRWQSLGDNAAHQKFMQGYDMNSYYYRQSDQNITDASFIRLKSISLNYNFPDQILEKLSIQNARIYLNGQNLFTWTPYKGYDPQSPGVLQIPSLTSVHLGLKLTL